MNTNRLTERTAIITITTVVQPDTDRTRYLVTSALSGIYGDLRIRNSSIKRMLPANTRDRIYKLNKAHSSFDLANYRRIIQCIIHTNNAGKCIKMGENGRKNDAVCALLDVKTDFHSANVTTRSHERVNKSISVGRSVCLRFQNTLAVSFKLYTSTS